MENQTKVLSIYIYIYSSWTVLTLHIILPFHLPLSWLFLFPSFYYKFVTLSHSMHIFPIQKRFSLSLSLSIFFFHFLLDSFFYLCLYLRLMNICFLEFYFLKVFYKKKKSLPIGGSPTKGSFPYCPIIN